MTSGGCTSRVREFALTVGYVRVQPAHGRPDLGPDPSLFSSLVGAKVDARMFALTPGR